ncbi:MAG: class I SAM-dependent methyltransferase [Candidatus Thorarchaeota archaeon]|jgi:SAM-dependent methyltransferase
MTESIRNSGVLEIRNRMTSISGGEVLDVGTQHGNFITVMMKSLKDYKGFVGIDISEENLEKAREEITDDSVVFKLMNAEELKFEDDAFDTVCISHSLHHLDNIDAVLGEMMRVVKPGGHLILQEIFSDDDQSDAQQTEILTHHLGARIDRMEGAPHFDTLSRQQVMDRVNGLGLSTVEFFETAWGLNCLDCDKAKDCEDPKSDYNMKHGGEEIDDVLKRAKEHPDTDDIQEEAILLLERLERTGYQSASLLFFICRK